MEKETKKTTEVVHSYKIDRELTMELTIKNGIKSSLLIWVPSLVNNIPVKQSIHIDLGSVPDLKQVLIDIEGVIHSGISKIETLTEELMVTDFLLNERQKLLDAIPESKYHGKCVECALEWIEKRLEKDNNMFSVYESLNSCFNWLKMGYFERDCNKKMTLEELTKEGDYRRMLEQLDKWRNYFYTHPEHIQEKQTNKDLD